MNANIPLTCDHKLRGVGYPATYPLFPLRACNIGFNSLLPQGTKHNVCFGRLLFYWNACLRLPVSEFSYIFGLGALEFIRTRLFAPAGIKSYGKLRAAFWGATHKFRNSSDALHVLESPSKTEERQFLRFAASFPFEKSAISSSVQRGTKTWPFCNSSFKVLSRHLC